MKRIEHKVFAVQLITFWMILRKMESVGPSEQDFSGLLQCVTHWWGYTIEMFSVMGTSAQSGEWINVFHKKAYQQLWSLWLYWNISSAETLSNKGKSQCSSCLSLLLNCKLIQSWFGSFPFDSSMRRRFYLTGANSPLVSLSWGAAGSE